MTPSIKAAHSVAPEHAEMIEALKEQLLLVFLRRLGGSIDIPLSEIDDTGQLLFAFSVNLTTKVFHFELGKKS